MCCGDESGLGGGGRRRPRYSDALPLDQCACVLCVLCVYTPTHMCVCVRERDVCVHVTRGCVYAFVDRNNNSVCVCEKESVTPCSLISVPVYCVFDVYIHPHTCVWVYVCEREGKRVGACMRVYVFIAREQERQIEKEGKRVGACMCVHVCVCMYVCTCMCVHVCVCMYVCACMCEHVFRERETDSEREESKRDR